MPIRRRSRRARAIRCSTRRSPTWASRRRAAAATSRSTWCSSAAAPTAACRTCAAPRSCCAATRSPRGVRALVVPGSQQVKKAAEAEGLDRIFIEAGAEWRESGCSMCIGMNGDLVAAGEYSRQHQQPQLRGPAGRRARAPCSPVRSRPPPARSRGRVTDPRELLNGSQRQRRSHGAHPTVPFAHGRAAAPPTSTPTRSSRRAS